jgi:hypothetical protein
MAASWYRFLDDTRTSADVVRVVRDYLARWTPEEISLLPAACRPPHVRDAADIEELHRCVVAAYLESRATDEALALLQKLTDFMGRAMVRLAQLEERARNDAELSPARKKAAGRDR